MNKQIRKDVTCIFAELNKDYPNIFDVYSKDGRARLNKYSEMSEDLDKKLRTSLNTIKFILDANNKGLIELNEFIIDLIENQIELLTEKE